MHTLLTWLGNKDIQNMQLEQNAAIATLAIKSKVPFDKIVILANSNEENWSSFERFLKKRMIPLPALNEQKRIAAILDKADAICRKRQQAIQLADDFLRSVFLDMFGDPVSNPKNWDLKTLKQLTTKILSGNNPKGGSNVYVEHGVAFLRSQNVWKNKLLLDDIVYIDKETHKK